MIMTEFANCADIRFPNLGIVFAKVGRYIEIGNFRIMYYGIIVASAFLIGMLVAQQVAKRTGQNPELYLDYLLWMVIPAILGARAYYVIFSWDMYKDNPMEILNLRHGGLGIVGGVVMGVLVLLIFARRRHVSPALMLDTLAPGLLTGQIIGRWGNFFNREAFGTWTRGLFAMQIPVDYFEQTGRMGELEGTGILDHLVTVTRGAKAFSYIQVHPTFLYEGMWNFLILLIILAWFRKKTFDGEMFCIYLIGYGIGRFLIESLRIDQLQIGSTGIAATQVVCILITFGGLAVLVWNKMKKKAGPGPTT